TVTMNTVSGRVSQLGQPQTAYNTVVDVDDQGRFRFPNLMPGGYTLQAQRRGAQNNSGGGASVWVGQGQQLSDIKLKLATQAVVTGKVVDADGEPFQNAQVALLRQFVNAGVSQWNQAYSAQTSDL